MVGQAPGKTLRPLLNIVVLTAVLSVLNTMTYSNARMPSAVPTPTRYRRPSYS